MTTRDPLDYGWWLASRSAGIVAYLLLSLAVLLGLSMALRLGSPRTRVAMRVVHERVALLALGAIAAHGLLLLGDPWLKPSLIGHPGAVHDRLPAGLDRARRSSRATSPRGCR